MCRRPPTAYPWRPAPHHLSETYTHFECSNMQPSPPPPAAWTGGEGRPFWSSSRPQFSWSLRERPQRSFMHTSTSAPYQGRGPRMRLARQSTYRLPLRWSSEIKLQRTLQCLTNLLLSLFVTSDHRQPQKKKDYFFEVICGSGGMFRAHDIEGLPVQRCRGLGVQPG